MKTHAVVVRVFASTMLSKQPLPFHIRSCHEFQKGLYVISPLRFSPTQNTQIPHTEVMGSFLPRGYDLSSSHTHYQILGFLIL